MKKALLPLTLITILSVLIYSCSSDDGDSAPPNMIQTPTAEPEETPTRYTLTVSAGDGGSVSTEGGTYDEGTEITITASSDRCYQFSKWSDGITTNERIIKLSQNLNLTVEFENLIDSTNISLVKFKFPCVYDFNLDQPHNETIQYKAGSYSWLSVSMQEYHEPYYYPSANDYNEAGYFSLDHHNFAHGDFNADGLQDLIIAWATFPHTIERESKFSYTFLINNGDGTMRFEKDYIKTPSIQQKHFAYRTIAADFNGDKIDDIVSASMGVIKRNPDGTNFTRWESIPLMLSSGVGNYYDATTNIEGQEDGISPPEYHTFGHELSVGDVDGDGDNDIYTGKVLLINDGQGNFSNRTVDLPLELKPYRNLWASVIADFNNDGIDDFFVPYAELTGAEWEGFKEYTGAYSISKNSNNSYTDSHIGYLTESKYGITNTKFNYAIAYDINLDGFKDVVVACTRVNPYYEGKGIQVFLNVEDTSNNSRKFEAADYLLSEHSVLDNEHGEGQLSVIDINNDGILDICHTTGAYRNEYGLTYYLNVGGRLEYYDRTNLPYVGQNQILGKENLGFNNKLKRAIPVNMDNMNWTDYLSVIDLNSENKKEIVFYSVISK